MSTSGNAHPDGDDQVDEADDIPEHRQSAPPSCVAPIQPRHDRRAHADQQIAPARRNRELSRNSPVREHEQEDCPLDPVELNADQEVQWRGGHDIASELRGGENAQRDDERHS
jgi:hypothetical protein